MEVKELKEAIDALGSDWEQFKKANDERLAGIEKDRGVAELEEKLDKIGDSLDALQKSKEQFEIEAEANAKRVEQLEAALDRKGAGGTAVEKAVAEYQAKFNEWIRSATEASDNNNKLAAELRAMEAKDVTIGSGAGGGFAVPEIISTQIAEQVQLYSPVRRDVKVVTVGSSDYKELVDIHGENSGWVGETDTRSGTATPSLRERAPTLGTVYCYPQATEEAMMDIFFNVQQWLVDSSGFEMARAEGIAALTGNGTNKPTGLLNTTPVSTTDSASPARSADALEYVPLLTGSPAGFTNGDGLLDMIYKLRSDYRINAVWAMNSLTAGTIRKLKMDGEYAWAPGLQAGEPARLLGYAVRFWEDLADLATNSHSILFGDFRRGYFLVDRGGLRMTVDDNLTTPGYVKFYIRRRVGGNILDNNAIKVGKYSAS